MNPSQIEYVLQRFLPDGWIVESVSTGWLNAGGFFATAKKGWERRTIAIPARALALSIEPAVDVVVDAIDAAFGLGRYAITPIVADSPEWSPYP
jgi:hypothetical protein